MCARVWVLYTTPLGVFIQYPLNYVLLTASGKPGRIPDLEFLNQDAKQLDTTIHVDPILLSPQGQEVGSTVAGKILLLSRSQTQFVES